MQSTFRIPADMSGVCRIDDCYKDKSKEEDKISGQIRIKE